MKCIGCGIEVGKRDQGGILMPLCDACKDRPPDAPPFIERKGLWVPNPDRQEQELPNAT